jgi:excisionase family DNA binding protein
MPSASHTSNTAREDDAIEVLTVAEAAKVLRISRGVAYALAREWRTTGGHSGLPVIELGRSLRVPRTALRQLIDPAGTTEAA